MSFANEKGGYQKTIEVVRQNSNTSITMLKVDFLKKTANYILNVTDFVTNTTPPLNLIEEPYFTIMPRGYVNETLADAEFRLPIFLQTDSIRYFRPTYYRTWLELARQIDLFFEKLTTAYMVDNGIGNPNFAVSSVDRSGKLRIDLSSAFLHGDAVINQQNTDDNRPGYLGLYLEVGPATQTILGMDPYIFSLLDVYGVRYNEADGHEQLMDFLPNGNLVFTDVQEPDNISHHIISLKPLSNFDRRLSIDVYSTFPMKSKLLTQNGIEQHEHILFRLPFAEQHNFKTRIAFSQTSNLTLEGAGSNISENSDVGLTNLCDKHPETLHQLLLPGNIQNVQLSLYVRYLTEDDEFIETPMDFTNALWYLRLLFIKKT